MPKTTISPNTQTTEGTQRRINTYPHLTRAQEVETRNRLGAFQGYDVESNLEELSVANQVVPQPPSIGGMPVTFTTPQGVEVTHEGKPDWGRAKLTSLVGKNKIWVRPEELPHMGYAQEIKWVNEGGVYDTVTLNYRDGDPDSYFGYLGYNQANTPIIAQSVPRESFNVIEASSIYPFMSSSVADRSAQDFFNSPDGRAGLGAGLGTTSLGTKEVSGEVQPTLSLAPLNNQGHNPNYPLNPSMEMVVSGLVYPADRGVLALIRFPSDSTGVSQPINTPATSKDEVLERVVAAINLGQGVGPNDGLPGGPLFEGRSSMEFPSLQTGQHDLYEHHTGQYPPHLNRQGSPSLNETGYHIGRVRLLTDPLAFNVQDNTSDTGIPILGGHTLYDQVNDTPTLLSATNFFGYRLPLRRDYSTLATPETEQDRFFTKTGSNLDLLKNQYGDRLEYAGGYVSFGQDNPVGQVARFRHTVNLMDFTGGVDYPTLVSTDTQMEFNVGSFALIHFKTEAAFERLVRDGIAPSDEDLYSINLDFTDLTNNTLDVMRPNLSFELKKAEPFYTPQVDHSSQATHFYPNFDPVGSSKIQRYNTFYSFVSGCIYVHPSSPTEYTGHLETSTSTPIDIDPNQHFKLSATIDFGTPPSTPYSKSEVQARALLSSMSSGASYVVEGGLAKHQSAWSTDLTQNLTIKPKGDVSAEITSLISWDSKSAFCTFSTSATRHSLLLSKPNRLSDNLGVEVVEDDVDQSSNKLMYHSSKRGSLRNLYNFSENGLFNPVAYNPLTPDDTELTSVSDWLGSNVALRRHRLFTSNLATAYFFMGWDNQVADGDPSLQYTPRSSGQSFSVYRYDEEGFKIYQLLDLLPIDGDEANGYYLELCSGWDRVDEQDIERTTDARFKYPQDRPVYRPTSTDPSGQLLEVPIATLEITKGVKYHIEFYPSVPFLNAINPPSTWDETTPNASIASLGGVGSPDLLLAVYDIPNPANLWLGNYHRPYDLIEISIVVGEWLGFQIDSTVSPYDTPPVTSTGNTSHVLNFWFNPQSEVLELLYENHPHPAGAVDTQGYLSYGITYVELNTSTELPEYGNLTQDLRGLISVSGLGNSPYYEEDNIFGISTEYNLRAPLASLMTLRKDTQERFLDESYRIESSLDFLTHFVDGGSTWVAARYSNTDSEDNVATSLANNNDRLKVNLQGPGLRYPNEGVNGGYISFPVRDESVSIETLLLAGSNPSPYGGDVARILAGHGRAGYLRNSWHLRRPQVHSDPNTPDWREAQVVGLPDMARNLLSGASYGTPPRGVLVYPYWDFDGSTNAELEGQPTNGNNLVSSASQGHHLPCSNKGTGDTREGDDWETDLTLTPKMRFSQANYSTFLDDFADPNDYPDVGYLRAFDLNFGKAPWMTPQQPYWNKDWVEIEGGQRVYHTAQEAQNYGQIEQGAWVRVTQNKDGSVSFSPIKLRLVGVDWDMISFVDPSYPAQRRDGLVHQVNGTHYLMRKRVMRVYVKVPGLTTWLDVGVMNGEVGESYVHWDGNKLNTNVGQMNPEGPTSDKKSPLSDGAGCCVSWAERYLVDEGLVCLDLDLDVGFVPAFNSLGYNPSESLSDKLAISTDEYLGFKKPIYVDNVLANKLQVESEVSVDSSVANHSACFEAPILVKVILSEPDHPKYEKHPDDPTKLVNAEDIEDTTLEVGDISNETPNNVSIYDVHPAPNKSYRGLSNPPDDRAPLWARRGLMGIEVLRQDGSNYDYDEVIDRPSFTATDLYSNPTLYYARTDSDRLLYESYTKATSSLTNKASYTHSTNTIVTELTKKPTKGEG
jgi:hypothetical protein